MVSHEEATEAVYIDFEGNRTDPSILCLLWAEDEEVVHTHHIINPNLWRAEFLEPGCSASKSEVVAVKLLGHLLEGRTVFAWTEYESDRLRDLLEGGPLEGLALPITNARPIAEAWKRAVHPGHYSHHLKKGERNALSIYMDLIDYQRYSDAAEKPIVGINWMETELRATGGDVSLVSAEARAAWRSTLYRNLDDCEGLRELMLVVGQWRATC